LACAYFVTFGLTRGAFLVGCFFRADGSPARRRGRPQQRLHDVLDVRGDRRQARLAADSSSWIQALSHRCPTFVPLARQAWRPIWRP